MASLSYLLIDAEHAARVLGLTSKRVRVLCSQGRIPGARLFGRMWQIPARARAGGALEIRVTPGTSGPRPSYRDREMAKNLIKLRMGSCELGVYIPEDSKHLVVERAKSGRGTKVQLGRLIDMLQNLHDQMVEGE
jgi:hypothetical protein